MQHLHIPAHPHPHYIPVGQIIRIESCSNYSKVYSAGMVRPIIASKVLQWFQDRLPSEDFARVHRSHLVNRQFISQITSDDLHKALVLRNGEEIPVSRRKQGAVGLWICSKPFSSLEAENFTDILLWLRGLFASKLKM